MALSSKGRNRPAARLAAAAARRMGAAKAPTRRVVAKRERHISGLAWLSNKGKISARERRAGEDYGVLFRVSAMEGFVSIRSCLNDEQGGGKGGGLPSLDLEAAAWAADCRMRLADAQLNILQGHSGLIAALACICGRGETPREVLGDKATDREVEDLISSLRTALQMLANKWRI
jgi:hypothetical protein